MPASSWPGRWRSCRWISCGGSSRSTSWDRWPSRKPSCRCCARRGRIVNIGSVNGRIAPPYLAPYSASKHALEAISKALRLELRAWGIRVSLIEPGATTTPIWDKSLAAADALADEGRRRDRRPLQGRPRRHAQATRKLAAPALPVDTVVRCVVHALTARRPADPLSGRAEGESAFAGLQVDSRSDLGLDRAAIAGAAEDSRAAMSIRNLDKIFDPPRIAVIGADETPNSVGYTVFRNLIASNYRGVVYPVNPKYEAVQGIQAYPDIQSVPAVADLAVICAPPATCPASCGRAAKKASAASSSSRPGFREAGEAGRKLEEAIRRRATQVRRHADPRPQLPGNHRSPPASERQLRRHDARAGPYRLHLPVGSALHVGARLGHRRTGSASRISSPWATCST